MAPSDERLRGATGWAEGDPAGNVAIQNCVWRRMRHDDLLFETRERDRAGEPKMHGFWWLIQAAEKILTRGMDDFPSWRCHRLPSRPAHRAMKCRQAAQGPMSMPLGLVQEMPASCRWSPDRIIRCHGIFVQS